MTSPLYIAVDLGAGSGRVFLAGLDPGELLLAEIHRFRYPPIKVDGRLCWDFPFIFGEIKKGLALAGERASELGRPVRSLGVDSWAVDYGLLDADGALMSNPVCYRDERTNGVMERVFARVPRETIFEKTGIQFLNFNTLFQLFSDKDQLTNAAKILLLPDLVNYLLTGKAAAEYTNATTTQMLNALTGKWDDELIGVAGILADQLAEVVSAGTDLGRLKPEFAAFPGLGETSVIATATHDTACAIAGTPLAAADAYISSGTWSLIGVERDRPLINAETGRHNFTNEGGVYGTFRFLKNVMGLWLFESCRAEWIAAGINPSYDEIILEVGRRTGHAALIYPDDERFLNPPSMLDAIRSQMSLTGQVFDSDPIAIAKTIFDSLAFRYASILKTIERLTERTLNGLHIVGGGGRNRYLNQATANASGLRICAGLTEATVVGNVMVQAITAGRFASLSAARQHVLDNFEFETFVPQSTREIDEAAARYAAIEAIFLKGH